MRPFRGRAEALPDRLADTASMFPSMSIYRGWDNDGTDNHTYNNRGNIAWAEDLRYMDHANNSSQESITRTWRLPAGRYSLALGSNADTNNSNRQGYKLSYTAAAFSAIYAGDPAPAGIGYSWIVTAGRGHSGSVSGHVGDRSWEDDSLFGGVGQGTEPLGGTRTSRWLGLHVTEPLTFNMVMARDANVPWPGGVNGKADTTAMFPFTVPLARLGTTTGLKARPTRTGAT